MRFCRYSRLRNKLDCRHLFVILSWNITDEPLALRCHHDDSIFLIMRVCVYYHLARPQVGGCLPSSTEHFALSLMLLFVSGTKASSLDGPPFDYSMPSSKHHTYFLPVPTLGGSNSHFPFSVRCYDQLHSFDPSPTSPHHLYIFNKLLVASQSQTIYNLSHL